MYGYKNCLCEGTGVDDFNQGKIGMFWVIRASCRSGLILCSCHELGDVVAGSL